VAKKLCPKISPNKTIAGAIGGIIISITFSVLLFLLFSAVGYTSIFNSYGLTIMHFIVYGLIVSIFTQLGDIIASYIKRKNNVKDYGSLLPGHGGVMDRVDGLSFNIVVTLIISLFIFM
jgi:phosphatidate cytidylyltransferase